MKKEETMKIGKWNIGLRLHDRRTFYYFHRQLMKNTEEMEHIRMWWFGWHFFIVHKLS